MKTANDCPVLPSLANNHHFRLGIPSYVLPADILPNVEAFAPFVDDIELALFESADKSNLPPVATIKRLFELAEQNGLSYTVHFPLDRQLGSDSLVERIAMQKQIMTILRLLCPLKPFAWILHLEGITAQANRQQIQTWQERIVELLPAIIDQAGDSRQICIENLFYPFEWCHDLLESFNLGTCIDIGHLLLTGSDVGSHLKQYLPRARVIHLHGIRKGKDHQALDSIPLGDLRRFINALGGFAGVLTLELFKLADISSSIKYLDRALTPNSEIERCSARCAADSIGTELR